MANKVTVAIVQASPVFNNLEASLEKALKLIEHAAAKGAKLITFGETWLAGYPAWLDHCPNAGLWNYEPVKEVFAQMRRNSVVVPGKETNALGELAAKLQITLVMGINERVEKGQGNGTLYNTLLTFGADGQILNHHRKLVPTFTERMVWGPGDGNGLKTIDTDLGRVGGLICWEHWMPHARQALHISGEAFHISVFPTVHEMHQVTTRQYAFEGRCFVLAAGLLMQAKDLPEQLLNAELTAEPEKYLLSGGSCIIAPNGSFVVEPVFDTEEIIIAEVDLTMIDKELMTLDVAGHYSRPDVFDFNVKCSRRT